MPTSCYWQSVWSLQNRTHGFCFCWLWSECQNQKPKAQSLTNNESVSSTVKDNNHAYPHHSICTAVTVQAVWAVSQAQHKTKYTPGWKINVDTSLQQKGEHTLKSGTSINSESALKRSGFVIRPMCGQHDVEMYLLFIRASWVGVDAFCNGILPVFDAILQYWVSLRNLELLNWLKCDRLWAV